IREPLEKSRSFAAIARRQWNTDRRGAAKLTKEAVAVADQVTGDFDMVAALALLSAMHVQVDELGKARELIERARPIAANLNDSYDRLKGRSYVARVLCLLGDSTGALALARTESIARDRDFILAMSVRILAAIGQITDAQRLATGIDDKTSQFDANAAIA